MDPQLIRGAELFNRAEFFACHEAWEEVWTPLHGPRRLFLQALIHVAVGCHHAQTGNGIGAARQFRKGLKKLAGYLPGYEGVDTERVYLETLRAFERVLTGDLEFKITVESITR